jgi:hypothetical protein
MLPHTLRIKSLRITPNANYKFIPPHLKHLPLLHLLRNISDSSIPSSSQALYRIINSFFYAQRALVQVDTIRPALKELWTLF